MLQAPGTLHRLLTAFVHRWSRCIRNWYLRCRETGRYVNSSSMRFLIFVPFPTGIYSSPDLSLLLIDPTAQDLFDFILLSLGCYTHMKA